MAQTAVDWLLEPGDPGVRYLALRDLCEQIDPAALRLARTAAHREGPIAQLLGEMLPQGTWCKDGPGYNPKYRSIAWSLIQLSQLGASIEEDERIGLACSYYLDHALKQGNKFSTNPAPSGTVDCLQGNMCLALTLLGCRDERLRLAYDWLARSQTGQGIAPNTSTEPGERYYAYKCGPGLTCGANGKTACAWGAVKVLLALAHIPLEWETDQTRLARRMAVDFFFTVDPITANYPQRIKGKPNRSWWKFGFPVFYITDLLQLVEALLAAGCAGDRRLEKSLAFIRDQADEQGRWNLEYDYNGKTWIEYGQKGQPSKWVTYRALKVLKAAQA